MEDYAINTDIYTIDLFLVKHFFAVIKYVSWKWDLDSLKVAPNFTSIV